MKISKILKKAAQDLQIGDEILMGRFRNIPAVVKGFGYDDKGQPTIKTTKGEKPLYKFRIKRLIKQLQ